jgi:hypothetical protein
MLEICAFFFSVGGMPDGLKLGVVNGELENFSNCEEYTSYYSDKIGGRPSMNDVGLHSCQFFGLACKFLNGINDSMVDKVNIQRGSLMTRQIGALNPVTGATKEPSIYFIPILLALYFSPVVRSTLFHLILPNHKHYQKQKGYVVCVLTFWEPSVVDSIPCVLRTRNQTSTVGQFIIEITHRISF